MLAIQGIAEAGSGHPGASFSAAEIMGVLYFHKMKNRPTDPFWEERDYFINSKAHSAPGFYAVLATAGYIDTKEIKTLRKLVLAYKAIQLDIRSDKKTIASPA